MLMSIRFFLCQSEIIRTYLGGAVPLCCFERCTVIVAAVFCAVIVAVVATEQSFLRLSWQGN